MNIFEKIKERLEEKADTIYKDKSKGVKLLFLNEAIEAVNEVAKEYTVPCTTCDKVNGWIPCSKRLPESSGEYNVIIDIYGLFKVTTLNYSSYFKKWIDDRGDIYNVIEWQPLPEIYKIPETPVKDKIMNTFNGSEV